MLQMFGLGGAKCPRCEHRNAASATFCANCGFMLGMPRNVPVQRENRWVTGNDELAVFFGIDALSKLFTQTLSVPGATRAWVLQEGAATEVPHGEYDAERFFGRLNHLQRDSRAEILITRNAPLPLKFKVDELHSAEHLSLSAGLSVGVVIDDVAAFARYFMTMPGSVTARQLAELLAPSVRQLAAEFVAGQSLREMGANADLRAQLDERLAGGLAQRLSTYGLAASTVETNTLRHDKLDAHREKVGSLWLLADEHTARNAHAVQLDKLYDDAEWQKIRRAESEARLRYRRTELAQDSAIEKAELSLANSERLQGVRAREIELYARLVDAKGRREAIAAGAGEVLAELEHEIAKKRASRGDAAADWAHVRHLAQIRMRTELELSQQQALEQRQLAQQRFSHQLLEQQIGNKVAQALLIEDESRKRAELARLHQVQQTAHARQAAIEEEQARGQWQALALVNAAHQREAERVQEWENQVAEERLRELTRASGAADALTQHEKLLRTIAAEDLHGRNLDARQLAVEAARHQQAMASQEAQWQHELRRIGQERELRFAELAHEADLVRMQIARGESIGAMSDTAKLALADGANAAALADLLKTQIHAGMEPAQLSALAGVVGAAGNVSAAEALRLAEERVQASTARREAEVDKERAHQLELIKLQNDVNKAALASQAQLGLGLAGHGAPSLLRCPNGHPVRAGERFCAQCGAPVEG